MNIVLPTLQQLAPQRLEFRSLGSFYVFLIASHQKVKRLRVLMLVFYLTSFQIELTGIYHDSLESFCV